MKNWRKLLTTTHRGVWTGKLRGIALGLLEGREEGAVALPDAGTQVFLDGLLLDKHPRGADVGIDERRVGELDLALEGDYLKGVGDVEHIAEKLKPEGLALTLS